MEKDRYQRAYEDWKGVNNGNVPSLKRTTTPSKTQTGQQISCLCLGGSSDKTSRQSFLKCFMMNLGICAVLVTYTVLGSFIFLSVERDTDGGLQQIPLATTIADRNTPSRDPSAWLNKVNQAAREQTVESIWEITEHLNILYRENWTRLAEMEIARFQESLIRRIRDDILAEHQNDAATAKTATEYRGVPFTGQKIPEYEWNFAKAFLYSLTVINTIGYGSVAPRSTFGKLATMGYATVGIPLTLIYLSSAGGLLSRCARGVFTRALCCCLCSSCGYCCYDERRMQENEVKMRRRRQQEDVSQQQPQQEMGLREPFYVRSNASTHPGSVGMKVGPMDEISSLSSDDGPNVTILAPISICLGTMCTYIMSGAFVLYTLEGWNFIDASYFCFMILSTIGFGDMIAYPPDSFGDSKNITIWFCSCYIMSGMALTAMCFNILQDEIVHRFAHQSGRTETVNSSVSIDELTSGQFALTS